MLKLTTKMTGKMEFMHSLNSSSLNNKFCIAKSSQNKSSICEDCYSNGLLKMYKNADKAFTENGILLSENIFPPFAIPKTNSSVFRFNAYGELINMNHLRNLMAMCEKNESTTFSLWTKRKNLIWRYCKDFGKPKNVIFIYSSEILNKREKKPKYFNKVFTVWSEDNKDKSFINCGTKKCFDCMTCYDLKDRKTYINEVLK